MELHKDDGSKYDMSLKGDVYTLTVHNPTVADAARYTLVVRIDKDSYFCSGYLEVRDADPEYYFAKKFKETINGYTNRTVKLVCNLNMEGAKIKWYKDGKVISVRGFVFTILACVYDKT